MKKKVIVGLLASVLTFGICVGVYAGSNLQEITAYLNGDIKFKVNGADWRPKDSDGNELLPITYNGSTYVPLRAVSNALKTPVDYESSTGTVILGEKVDGVNFFSDTIKIYDKESYNEDVMDKSQLILGGKQHNGAFRFKTSYVSNNKIQFNLGKSYSKLHLVIGAKEGDASIQVVNGTDQIFKEFSLKEGETKEIDVDIIDSQYPKILAKTTGGKKDGQVLIFKETTVK